MRSPRSRVSRLGSLLFGPTNNCVKEGSPIQRTIIDKVLALLAVLALLHLGHVGALPTESVSGKMEFVDRVVDGLRHWHEKDLGECRQWLRKVAPTGDPRVGVVLGELIEKYWACGILDAQMDQDARLFNRYYAPPVPSPPGTTHIDEVTIALKAWKAKEAGLRLRAKQLPQ